MSTDIALYRDEFVVIKRYTNLTTFHSASRGHSAILAGFDVVPSTISACELLASSVRIHRPMDGCYKFLLLVAVQSAVYDVVVRSVCRPLYLKHLCIVSKRLNVSCYQTVYHLASISFSLWRMTLSKSST